MNQWKLLKKFDFCSNTGEVAKGKVNDIVFQRGDTFTLEGTVIMANEPLFSKNTDIFEVTEFYEVNKVTISGDAIEFECNELPNINKPKWTQLFEELLNRI